MTNKRGFREITIQPIKQYQGSVESNVKIAKTTIIKKYFILSIGVIISFMVTILGFALALKGAGLEGLDYSVSITLLVVLISALMGLVYIPLRAKKNKKMKNHLALFFIHLVVFVGYFFTVQGGYNYYINKYSTVKSVVKPTLLTYSLDVENQAKKALKEAKKEAILTIKKEVKELKNALENIPTFNSFLEQGLTLRAKNYDSYIAKYMSPYLSKYKKSMGISSVKSTRNVKNTDEVREIISPIFEYIYSIKYARKIKDTKEKIAKKEGEILTVKIDGTPEFDSLKKALKKTEKEYINQYNQTKNKEFLKALSKAKSAYKTSFLALLGWSVLAFILVEILILNASLKVLDYRGSIEDEVEFFREKTEKLTSSLSEKTKKIGEMKEYIQLLEEDNAKMLADSKELSELKLNPFSTTLGQEIVQAYQNEVESPYRNHTETIPKPYRNHTETIPKSKAHKIEGSEETILETIPKSNATIPKTIPKSIGMTIPKDLKSYLRENIGNINFRELNDNYKVKLIKQILLAKELLDSDRETLKTVSFEDCDFFNVGKEKMKKILAIARGELEAEDKIFRGKYRKYFVK